MPSGAIAITGANGYVGGVLRAAFASAGYRVLSLQRSIPPAADQDDYISYTLENGPATALGGDVRAVVHCAYDLRARNRADIDRINLGGIKRLIEKAGSTPILLISSMSAYSGTKQIYGRNKLACEAAVAANGGTSLRLGLVYGQADGGMIGSLRRLSGLPAIPALRPDPYQYTVHSDDMARCVVSAVEQPPTAKVLGVAHPRRVPFSEILRTLRSTVTDKPLRGVPTPSTWPYHGLRALETLGLRGGLRADSMLGLISPAPEVPNVDVWAKRGVELRDFSLTSVV